ncbi:hypothetical protein SASPL_109173 [Salvia splendens]|uniref:Solute carrier family 25 (Peroxisomal adenine nucleotide transporter), member 17 n=1 Tax=Salvia splendens TaxID=180675 RepID=A0A8X9A7A8_SALSN|nr:hypothetical protein SASPL_109173 [Salvia splendens]
MESLVEATSGAVGALVSTTILYPLDTCKTRYQAENRAHQHQRYRNISDVLWEAISQGQVLSLYQGLGTKNLQSFISQFIYFYGYSFFKRLYLRESKSKSIGTATNLLIAAAAGACTAIATQALYPNILILVLQPLDTASSRMQTSDFGKSKGLWKSLSEGTFSDAFDGLGISLLLTANPSIQYTVFDQLKNRLLKSNVNKQTDEVLSPEAISAFSAFAYGAVSKCIATCLTYPAIRKHRVIELIWIMHRCKVVIQSAKSDESEEGKPKSRPRKSITATLCSIWEREGILGFFKGLQAQMLKTVLSSALLLMIKEKVTKTTWQSDASTFPLDQLFRNIKSSAKQGSILGEGGFDPVEQRGGGIRVGEENSSDEAVEEGEKGEVLRVLRMFVADGVDHDSVGLFGSSIVRHC